MNRMNLDREKKKNSRAISFSKEKDKITWANIELRKNGMRKEKQKAPNLPVSSNISDVTQGFDVSYGKFACAR